MIQIHKLQEFLGPQCQLGEAGWRVTSWFMNYSFPAFKRTDEEINILCKYIYIMEYVYQYVDFSAKNMSHHVTFKYVQGVCMSVIQPCELLQTSPTRKLGYGFLQHSRMAPPCSTSASLWFIHLWCVFGHSPVCILHVYNIYIYTDTYVWHIMKLSLTYRKYIYIRNNYIKPILQQGIFT